MSEHTTGNWYAVDLRHQRNGQIAIRSQGQTQHGYAPNIANVLAQNPGAEANARLIAAAPDLLAALQAIVDETHGAAPPDRFNLYDVSGDALLQARAAIQKAHGAQP